MECFFALSENFRTQDEPAYCGLSTLVMVLNAMRVDPGRAWKGPWRFFHESMLDCCEPLEVIREKGISLSKFACLARCNGADSSVTYAEGSTVEEFREVVLGATSAANVQREGVLVCTYDRKELKQTGRGHFSPIGGYDPASDMVLVMDVARFKYPPHWVPLPTIFNAMLGHDDATGRSRGWVLMKPSLLDPLLFTLKRSSHFHWPELADWWAGFKQYMHETQTGGGSADSPQSEICCDPQRALERVVETLPNELLENVLTTFGREHGAGALEDVRDELSSLIRSIEQTTAHRIIREKSQISAERVGVQDRPVDQRHLVTLVLLASLDDEVAHKHCVDTEMKTSCGLVPLMEDLAQADEVFRQEVSSTRRMLDSLSAQFRGAQRTCLGGGNCRSQTGVDDFCEVIAEASPSSSA